ncbi:ABC transporter substrate-binding protein [Paenibacillus larvae]
MSLTRKFTPAVLAAVVLLAGCGIAKDESKGPAGSVKPNAAVTTNPSASSKIKVTDFTGREVIFDKAPVSVATLALGDLDIVHKLGANIVGRPATKSPLPSEGLKNAAEIGNTHQPNFEKLAAAKPDLLIVGAGFNKHIATVEKNGTKVLMTSANSVADIQKSITLFGEVLEKKEEAKKLTQAIDDKLHAMSSAGKTGVRALLVYGAPGTYMAALPNSLSGDVMAKSGGENVAADYPQTKDFPQYAELSSERIVESNPDVVYLITHGDPGAVKKSFEAEMSKNAAWKNLKAVKEGSVIILPPDLFGSSPGTKITDALDFMSDNLKTAAKK